MVRYFPDQQGCQPESPISIHCQAGLLCVKRISKLCKNQHPALPASQVSRTQQRRRLDAGILQQQHAALIPPRVAPGIMPDKDFCINAQGIPHAPAHQALARNSPDYIQNLKLAAVRQAQQRSADAKRIQTLLQGGIGLDSH